MTGSGGNFRVLIADDNPHIRSIVEQAVRRLDSLDDCAIVTATAGDEVLAALEQGPFDLAIMDVYMPVLDGVRILGRIRDNPSTAGMPVLVVSSGGEEARLGALAAGADHFLPKPLRLVDVQEAVATLLRLPRPA